MDVQELEKGMEKMLNAYDAPSAVAADAFDMEEGKSTDVRRKKVQPKQPAKATGKRTRASQRKHGASYKILIHMSLCWHAP